MVQKVEHFNAFAGIRQDLFGFIDLLAVHPHYGTVGVQVCGQDWQTHIKKISTDCREPAILWLLGGNRLLLVGWRQLKGKWTPRLKEYSLETDFPEITSVAREKLAASVEPDFDWLKDRG